LTPPKNASQSTLRPTPENKQSGADCALLLNHLASASSSIRPDLCRAEPAARPTPMMALPVSGMNHALNSQEYTQAAWWNRILIAGR